MNKNNALPKKKNPFPTKIANIIINRKEEENKQIQKILRDIQKEGSAGMGGQQYYSLFDYAPMQWYTAGLTPDVWLLPKLYKQKLRWVKVFFALDPYIQTILVMKALYPLSRFTLSGIPQSAIEYFEKVLHTATWDINETLEQMAISWHKYGEVTSYGHWDGKKWTKVTVFDPEFIEIEKEPLGGNINVRLEMPPDTQKQLEKILKSEDPKHVALKKRLDPHLVEAIIDKKPIDLDTIGSGNPYRPPECSYLLRDLGPGQERGEGEIFPLFRTLMRKDKYIRAQVAIAERSTLPIELWTVGSLTGDPAKDIIPDEETLIAVKDMIKQAMYTPPFSIVYTPLLKYEAIGVSGKLLNLRDEFEQVENEILVGLGVNKSIILGEGPGLASNARTMSLVKLIMELKTNLNRWERWLKNFIFLPMCIANNFYDKLPGGQKKYWVPEINWEKSLDIQGEDEERKTYIDLWNKGAISTKTLFTKLPRLNYDVERTQLEKEKNTVFDSHSRLPDKIEKFIGQEKVKPETPANIEEVIPTKPEKPEQPIKPTTGILSQVSIEKPKEVKVEVKKEEV